MQPSCFGIVDAETSFRAATRPGLIEPANLLSADSRTHRGWRTPAASRRPEIGEWEVRGEGQGRDSLSLAHACHGVWSRGGFRC
jgi:hypothetical protein